MLIRTWAQLVFAAFILFTGSKARAADGSVRAEKLKVAVLDLAANEVRPELASTLTSVLATELERLQVFSVISNQEIRAMLSHDAIRQMAGCDNPEKCSSGLAAPLGARYLASGSVGKVGDNFTLNFVLTDLEKGVVVGRASSTVSDPGKLLESAARSSKVLVSKVLSERQGMLLVTCSERGATVKIDGEIVGTTPLARRPITWGPHLLEVEKTGFVVAAEDINVTGSGLIERNFSLIPSEDFLSSYETSAKRMRIGAWVATGAAAVALGTAVYFQVDHTRKANEFLDQRRAYQNLAEPTQADFDGLTALQTRAQGSLTKTYVFGAFGVLLGAGATYFWIAGGDPDRYARYREVALKELPSGDRLAVRFLDGSGVASLSLTWR